MYYSTNQNPEELTWMTSRKVEKSGQTYSDFKMDFPLQLEYIALHPDQKDDYFSMASLAPDRHYYASASFEEMGSIFAKTSLHHHNYYELLFVLSGNMYQIIENQRHLYTPGSCCMLNRNVLHMEEHNTDFEVAFLGISDAVLRDVYRDLTDGYFKIEQERSVTDLEKFLLENISGTISYDKKYMDFIPRPDSSRTYARMRELFERLSDELLHPRIGSSHMIRALIAGILYLLSDRTCYETSVIQIGTDAENYLYNQIDRIMHDTCGRASRSFLESELHYSGDYLNKITKKYTGFNIHDFGMTICMGLAAEELLRTQKSIGEIAAALGFSNRTHFYRQFEKIYHMSPAEYRRQFIR